MSLYDYQVGIEITKHNYPFYALIQAAMRQADSFSLDKLRYAFPVVFLELKRRYNAPGGMLPEEELEELKKRIADNPAPKGD
jgi:hypothetical protein